MPTLTAAGRRLVEELARRHGFGEEAVTRMLAAVAVGHGRMAQFDHPELGGSGQWMAGGMVMLGDMFNQGLKGRVDGLCNDLSNALAEGGDLVEPPRSPDRGQDQSQGRSQGRSQDRDGDPARSPGAPLFASSSSGSWWPSELGTPSAVGSQNATRYAWFADARRLVVDDDEGLRVHDTLDHRIGGFSQRQGGGEGFSMSSQHGTVDPATLPIVSREGSSRPSASRPSGASRPAMPAEGAAPSASGEARSGEGRSGGARRDEARSDDARAEDARPEGGLDEARPEARPDAAGPAASARSGAERDEGDGVADAHADADANGAANGADAAVRGDPLQLIERLGRLREQGLLTEEEFTSKKRELLARL